MKRIMLNVNGVDRWVVAEKSASLAHVLREQMLLTGCKVCCEDGQCGSCTVMINGKPDRCCTTPLEKVPADAKIVTIEGIGTPGNLHPLQVAWMAHGGAQCGICTPGFIMSAKALLDRNLSPTREEVRAWFNRNRNLCRCTGYKPLVDAVMDAAAMLRGEMTADQVMGKAKENGSILGTRYHRPSALAKVTGTWDFGADIALRMPPDTLRLALVQAKVSHANIKSYRHHRSREDAGRREGHHLEGREGQERHHRPDHLPDQQGRRLGPPDPVQGEGVPVRRRDRDRRADTEEHARAAADKVKVDLEVLPAYMTGFAALAPDAIEIHPGVPNVYYEQGVVKGEDTKPLIEKAAATVDIDHLLQPAAPSASRAGLRRGLHRRRRRPHHPVQEHRPASASRDDLPRHRRCAREAADHPEPHRRHFRLQVLPDHGSAARRRRAGHRPAGVPGLQPVSEHHLHRQALARQRQHPSWPATRKAS